MSTVDWLPVMTDPGIVTSFRAELAAGTTAKLRVFRRDDVWVMKADGTGAARLTNAPQWDSLPWWGS